MMKQSLNLLRLRLINFLLGGGSRGADTGFKFRDRVFPETDKWSLSEFIVSTLVPIIGIKPYPLDELLFMCSAVSFFHPDVIFEWGTHLGKSARIFYEAGTYFYGKMEIHTVDLPASIEHVENIKEVSKRGIFIKGLPILTHTGDGLDNAIEQLSSRQYGMPLFFLDGDHSYNSVWRELNGIHEKCNSAVVLIHDTFFQSGEDGYNCDPFEAVSRFVCLYSLPVYSTSFGLPGMSMTYWSS